MSTRLEGVSTRQLDFRLVGVSTRLLGVSTRLLGVSSRLVVLRC